MVLILFLRVAAFLPLHEGGLPNQLVAPEGPVRAQGVLHRVGVGVAHQEPRKVQGLLRGRYPRVELHDLGGPHRQVVASVGLCGEVELVPGQVRELLLELEDDLQVVLGSGLVAGGVVGSGVLRRGVAEPHPAGLLDVHHVRHQVPGIRVEGQGLAPCLGALGAEGTMLPQKPYHSTASWATIGPVHHRIVDRVILALHEPVENLLGFCDV
mmetsp:Transcript_20454/g.29602  ORF Transcript_20454/g.29602 Transcript_20454/m.29602 type:complete len:211 (-) Transcript_20454:574-1206(-)